LRARVTKEQLLQRPGRAGEEHGQAEPLPCRLGSGHTTPTDARFPLPRRSRSMARPASGTFCVSCEADANAVWSNGAAKNVRRSTRSGTIELT
jgi:hypothetical protein